MAPRRGWPLSYALLCGQAALLLANLLLLQGVSRSHQHNATEAAPPPPAAAAPAWAYSDPRAPLVLCTYLPEEFVECEEPVDHGGNATAQQELGHGCVKLGGQAYGDVEHTRVQCRALDGIECAEPRTFLRGSKPCINAKDALKKPLHYPCGDRCRSRHF